MGQSGTRNNDGGCYSSEDREKLNRLLEASDRVESTIRDLRLTLEGPPDDPERGFKHRVVQVEGRVSRIEEAQKSHKTFVRNTFVAALGAFGAAIVASLKATLSWWMTGSSPPGTHTP